MPAALERPRAHATIPSSPSYARSPKRGRHLSEPVGRLVAVLPAHNEEAGIAAAVQGLQNQTSPPDRIVVVADNCTDRTAEAARAHGAEVFATEGNTAKKAGALNQFLAVLLLELEDEDMVLVQDADSALDPDFLMTARRYLKKQSMGAVGASSEALLEAASSDTCSATSTPATAATSAASTASAWSSREQPLSSEAPSCARSARRGSPAASPPETVAAASTTRRSSPRTTSSPSPSSTWATTS